MNFLLGKLFHCAVFSIISKKIGTSQGPRIDTKFDLHGLFSRNIFLTERYNRGIWNYSMISLDDHRWWQLRPEFQEVTEGLCFTALVWIRVQVPPLGSSLPHSKEELLHLSACKERATDWTSCWSALEIQLWAEISTRKYASVSQSFAFPDGAH